MLKRTAIVVSVWLAGCSPSAPAGDTTAPANSFAAPRARNVILVTIDTLRADVLGAYGGDAATPVLDRLAAEGWLFRAAYSASMLTNPAHASLMTSLYPRDHGVYDNETGIQDGARTLAGALQKAGMQTGAVIGFAHLNPEVANLGQGFAQIVRAPKEERRADATSREALAMIDGFDATAPFFLWLHYVDPHAPYEPPAGHPPHPRTGVLEEPMQNAVRAAPGFQRQHPWFRRVMSSLDSVEAMRARYIAEVEATDAGLGALVDGLETRGLAAQTALVITADHGENFGEHGLYFHHGGLYDATVHIPLIIRGPAIRPARLDAVVESIDIAPTILALVGAPRWEPMRGRSLAAMAQGGPWPKQYAFSEHMAHQQVAVRSADGLLIVHRRTTRQFPSYPMVAGTRERYDRRADPSEQTPLNPRDARAVALERALGSFLDGGLHLAARPAEGQDKESLRALGYIE